MSAFLQLESVLFAGTTGGARPDKLLSSWLKKPAREVKRTIDQRCKI
jgi:hypothetical protein